VRKALTRDCFQHCEVIQYNTI